MADRSPRSAQADAEAMAFSGQLGQTIQRLRKAYNLTLSELSEQSGVAKSIISQIERNETNPTLATIWRLSQALDVSIDRVLSAAHDADFVEEIAANDLPILRSEDGKMELAIIGWSKTVEWLQWYDVTAQPGAVLASEGHQRGSVECLSVLAGRFEVEAGEDKRIVDAGGTVRYRCDRPHTVRCLDGTPQGRATMVCILKAAVME
ncbi:MAG: helix-turn-helix transcriptional regulator [Devosiaceae bacterium]|nr:helix-turn-helix transcriptional regulator [Devosiaceae bacterium MH13]